MTIDNNLLWVLIGTAGLSLLSLVYVLVDEGNKRRRYEQQKEKEAAQPPAVVPAEEAGIPAAPPPSAPEPVAAQPASAPHTADVLTEASPGDNEEPETSPEAVRASGTESLPNLEDSALAQEPDTAPEPAEERPKDTP
ncbi:hypothetical protein [Synechococcus sp. R55.2]|uniref:hypothetical protein n=1 Tax=Synechococcus sp. R55.2 TaxID=2964496 RepID=UPI0039C44E31